jgi:hypothetical protein
MATDETAPVDSGCANGCNAPFGVRCSVCNTENRADEDLDPSCARCGSSTGWVDCWACCHGVVLEEDDEGTGLSTVTCEWCNGNGGSAACLSSAEWCEANPLPGHGEVERT